MNRTRERTQTFGEELANTLSHGLGFLLAVASLPILVSFAAQRGGAASVVGTSLFSATMIVLYLVSALYHALPAGRAKHWFNRLDHAAIYLLIAAVPLVERLPAAELAWLVAGGLAYTLGAVVFHFDSRLRYGHFVWHLFVLAGTACHFVAVLLQTVGSETVLLRQVEPA